MVRLKKHRDTDYLLVDTTITVHHKDGTETVVPAQMQVNLKNLPEKSFGTLYRYTSSVFDRNFDVNKPKIEAKKNWFSKFFSS